MPVDNDFKINRLKKACVRARLDFDDLIAQCRDGRAQFWDHPEACAVSALGTSGDYKTCYVMVAGGTIPGLRALLEEISDFARDQGCQALQTNGRMGFLKPFAHDAQNFKPVAVMYERPLS